MYHLPTIRALIVDDEDDDDYDDYDDYHPDIIHVGDVGSPKMVVKLISITHFDSSSATCL